MVEIYNIKLSTETTEGHSFEDTNKALDKINWYVTESNKNKAKNCLFSANSKS
jgi:hypothetical protein